MAEWIRITGHSLRRESLEEILWNEVLGNLKLAEIVGFPQEWKVLLTGRKKDTKALFINK